MSDSNIETKVESLIKSVINKLGYDLYDVQFVKEGKDYILRITIDNEKGISIEDCEKVSNSIDELLDDADYIKTSYSLEVSSPGIERHLRKPCHYEKQIGQKINVRLFKPIDKKRELEGILKSYKDNVLELEVNGANIQIDISNISVAKKVCDVF